LITGGNMKEYFSHDYNARNDTKLVKLFMKYGLSGVGAYWCIIEMLYEEGGYLLRSEYGRISFELRTDVKTIKSIVESFDLFKKDTKKFWSETGIDRLNQRIEKSAKARYSVNKRWEKYERNTDVKQTQNDSNTIKVKKSKEKEIKENIDLIYKSYPIKCPINNSSTNKSKKDKDKIKKLLSNMSKDDLLLTINIYIAECKKSNRFIKNFSTFLNNLPDYEKPKEIKPISDGIKRYSVRYDGFPEVYNHSDEEIEKFCNNNQTSVRVKS